MGKPTIRTVLLRHVDGGDHRCRTTFEPKAFGIDHDFDLGAIGLEVAKDRPVS